MTSKRHSPVNEAKTARARVALDWLLEQSLRHGFHGVVRLELTIAEGTIQSVGRSLEQVERSHTNNR